MVAIRDIVRLNEAGVGDFELDAGARASFQGITATWQGNSFVVNSLTPEAQAAHPNVRVNQPLPRALRGGMVNAARTAAGMPRLDFTGDGNLRTPAPAAQPGQRTPGNGADASDAIRARELDLRARELDLRAQELHMRAGANVPEQANLRKMKLQRSGLTPAALRAISPGNFRPLTSALMITALQDMLIEVNEKAINGDLNDVVAYNDAVNTAIGTWFAVTFLPVLNKWLLRPVAGGVTNWFIGIVGARAGKSSNPLTPVGFKRRVLQYIASESAGLLVTQVAIRNETVRTYILELIASEYFDMVKEVFRSMGIVARSIDRAIVRNWPEDLPNAYDAVKNVLGDIRPETRGDNAPSSEPSSSSLPTADELFGN